MEVVCKATMFSNPHGAKVENPKYDCIYNCDYQKIIDGQPYMHLVEFAKVEHNGKTYERYFEARFFEPLPDSLDEQIKSMNGVPPKREFNFKVDINDDSAYKMIYDWLMSPPPFIPPAMFVSGPELSGTLKFKCGPPETNFHPRSFVEWLQHIELRKATEQLRKKL